MNKPEKYYVAAYFDEAKRGLNDNLATNDFDEAISFAHEQIGNGSVVEIKNHITGNTQTYTPDEWLSCIDNGDVPSAVRDLA